MPSRDRKGTNALLLSPPGVIELGFGPDSFSYHLKQATARGLKPRIMENPRIELDLDEPKDIEILFKSTPQGSCHELLFRLIKEASQAVRP
jgi:2-phospho-L-lactate guanylyltransferase